MEPIYLTEGQCRYLHLGSNEIAPQGDLCITDKSPQGWIFVEQASYVGEEGSGVWVDAMGHERHGP